MATINAYTSKTGVTTYRVRVQRKGHKVQTATLPSLREARRYATMVEGEIIAGRHFPESTSKKHTLAELLARYDREIVPTLAPSTQRTQRQRITFWSQRLGHKSLSDITKADVVAVKEDLTRRGRAAGTIHHYIGTLSHALTIAIREHDWLTHNVVSTIARPPKSPGKTRYLTDAERSKLLEECRRSKNPDLYDLVVVALYTGLRRGSLFSLRCQDVDTIKKTLTVPHLKTKNALVLPLVGEAYEILTRRCTSLQGPEYLFPEKRNGKQGGCYRRAFEEALKRAGITGASFHTLRHSSASYLIQAGIPLYVVSQILAHTSVTMTQKYAHLQLENLRDALEVLSHRLAQ
jgi:integrase